MQLKSNSCLNTIDLIRYLFSNEITLNCAPIALFVYRRLEHTRHAIESLLENKESSATDLIVFSDGPKAPKQVNDVDAVRNFVRTVRGFRSVRLVERHQNIGLAQSITSGISEVLKTNNSVIVVEDDLITSPFFLAFMNDGLLSYREDNRVVSIHGYVYPVDDPLPETFFLRGADCWGWATWRRGWQFFNPDGASLLHELERRNLMSDFDFEGAFPFTQMLRDQIEGRNDSWAIRWYASAFLSDKLTLYPGRSLVQNTGIDGSGTHCGLSSAYQCILSDRKIELSNIAVEDSKLARRAFHDFACRGQTSGIKRGFRSHLWRLLGWNQ